MNSVDKMEALCVYHGVSSDGVAHSGYRYYPTHSLLDILDRKIGVDTRGGLHHDSFCFGYATPNNQVGTRIRLHEEYIRPDIPPNYDEWCGEHISASHWGLFPGE